MKINLRHAHHARIGLLGLVQSMVMISILLAGTARGGFPELPVPLGSAGDFVILAKTGISTVPDSDITGDMGVSPIDHTAITGFALTPSHALTEFSTSTQVDGNIYAANYQIPTPTKLSVAVSHMEAAYTEAAGRINPNTEEENGGSIAGLTFVPGLHRWSTDVNIAGAVTLDAGGDPDAVFIFQISGILTMASNQDPGIILAGNAQAKNIFWQVAGGVTIGTDSHFEGIILSQTAIHLLTRASFNGKLLAQTAVTLDQNVVNDVGAPLAEMLVLQIVSEHGEADPDVGLYLHDEGDLLTNSVTAVETIGSTQYVNIGWTMLGNEPGSGFTNEMTMSITNNAVLTWLWDTNYFFDASASPIAGGEITGDPNDWYAAGTEVTVTAVANSNYFFTGWTGNVGPNPGNATQNLTMSEARTIVANFVPTDLPCGTPVSLGAIMELDLEAMFSGAGLTYSASSSDADIMSAAIKGADILRLRTRAYGFVVISVTATDGGGNAELRSFPVSVVDNVDIISNQMMPNEPWNPRFEQRLVLENTTGLGPDCPAVALRLIFTDLKDGIVVENQTGVTPNGGHPMIEWHTDFPNGATQGVSIIYVGTGAFRPDLYPPTVTAHYVLLDGAVAPGQDGLIHIDLIRVLDDGRVVLEFSSVAGRTYEVHHAPSVMGDWVLVPLLLKAGGNRTQWIDYGPPATPPLGDSRVYRVREVTP
jgi:hypothetical protein